MMTFADAYAIAEARSCIAALADTAATVDTSIAYEHALLHLDGDYAPSISPLAEIDTDRLLARLEAAVEVLVTYGLDGLSAELLLDMTIVATGSAEAF